MKRLMVFFYIKRFVRNGKQPSVHIDIIGSKIPNTSMLE
jgi:hypothetical protein